MSEGPSRCTDDQRFLLELEFVQCLANPDYLNYLAQNNYFDDVAFVNFLKYLNRYPHALFFLDLLQSAEFRTAIARTSVKEMVHTQQFFHWQHWRSNRLIANQPQIGVQLTSP